MSFRGSRACACYVVTNNPGVRPPIADGHVDAPTFRVIEARLTKNRTLLTVPGSRRRLSARLRYALIQLADCVYGFAAILPCGVVALMERTQNGRVSGDRRGKALLLSADKREPFSCLREHKGWRQTARNCRLQLQDCVERGSPAWTLRIFGKVVVMLADKLEVECKAYA